MGKLKSLILVLLLPLAVHGQLMPLKDTARKSRRVKLEGFIQVGYINELWIISGNLKNAYSSLSYKGEGGYLGGGFCSRRGPKSNVGVGLSADYLGYIMDKSLTTNELAQVKYAFLRFTPAFYYYIKSKSALKMHLGAVGSMYVPMHARENNYLQYGIKACAAYNAFEVNLGYSFSRKNETPSTLTNTDLWREQMFMLGMVFYPGRLNDWGKIKAKIKHEFKH